MLMVIGFMIIGSFLKPSFFPDFINHINLVALALAFWHAEPIIALIFIIVPQ